MRAETYDQYDQVLVDLIVANRHPAGEKIGAAEAAHAVRRLVERRFTDGQIAYRLGTSRRRVHRIRKRWGIPAVLAPSTNGTHQHVDAPTRPSRAG